MSNTCKSGKITTWGDKMTLEELTPEDLTPEEVKSRVIRMDNRQAKEFLENLPPETQRKYRDYVLQRTREFLSYLAKHPES
jgi:hypothetical protein